MEYQIECKSVDRKTQDCTIYKIMRDQSREQVSGFICKQGLFQKKCQEYKALIEVVLQSVSK